jgi:hypothetical protein
MPRMGSPSVRPRHAKPRRQLRGEWFSVEVDSAEAKDQRKHWLFQYASIAVQLASAIATWIVVIKS